MIELNFPQPNNWWWARMVRAVFRTLKKLVLL